MAKVTRGFVGHNRGAQDLRLPPGQYDTGESWPVLTAEATPKLSTTEWSFAIEGLIEQPTATDLLLASGVPAVNIRVERFGPS